MRAAASASSAAAERLVLVPIRTHLTAREAAGGAAGLLDVVGDLSTARAESVRLSVAPALRGGTLNN